MLVPSDIQFFYSGGETNKDPSQSLGGNISNYPIIGLLDNLFLDVTPTESAIGYTDFRCFYAVNTSVTGTFSGCYVSIVGLTPEGSAIALGYELQNDIQHLIVGGSPTTGTFELAFGGDPFTVIFDTDPTVFSSNIASAILTISPLSDVVVAPLMEGLFQIEFQGDDGNKFQPLLQVISTSLDGGGTIATEKYLDGSPINKAQDLLGDPTIGPGWVDFYTTMTGIGTLYPGDILPIWVQRVTPAGALNVSNDRFTARLMGTPLDFPPGTTISEFAYLGTGGVELASAVNTALDDIQLFTISGSPTSGTITLQFNSTEVVFNYSYSYSVNTFITVLQNSLNDIVPNGGIFVTSLNAYNYLIDFGGANASSLQPLIQVVGTTLNGGGEVVITKVQNGQG